MLEQQQGRGVFSINNSTNVSLSITSSGPPPPPDPNRTIPIILNIKTDEEIIAECEYITDDLLCNSTNERADGTPPRPLNSFFIYSKRAGSNPKYVGMEAKIKLPLIA